MFAYSLVHVPDWRRDIFEDVYGIGQVDYCGGADDYTCEEWCLWLRKAMAELQELQDGNFEQRYGFTLKPAIDDLRNELNDVEANFGECDVSECDVDNHPPIFRLAIRDM